MKWFEYLPARPLLRGKVHADSATGDVACDRWHEGTGFLTHHLALSLSFEAAVRAVNPATTTPYWDFTVDGEAIKRSAGGPSMLVEVSAPPQTNK